MLANKYVYSYVAKELQVSSTLKVGDCVHVGYIRDCDSHNYQVAVVTKIRKVKYYPTGYEEIWEYQYQVWVKFADGVEIEW